MNVKSSCDWLKHFHLFSVNAGFLCATHDKVLATVNYRNLIIQDLNMMNDVCRICKKTLESIEHLISVCKVSAPQECTKRHDNLVKIILSK